jgi:hypothetical protein
VPRARASQVARLPGAPCGQRYQRVINGAARDAQAPEVVSRLVGHRSTVVIETVYSKQLRPVIEGGADVMKRWIARAGLDDIGQAAGLEAGVPALRPGQRGYHATCGVLLRRGDPNGPRLCRT